MPSINTPVQTSAQAQDHTTAAYPFFQCNPTGKLFTVCEGIPSLDALNQAMCFLLAAKDIAADTALKSHERDSGLWAAPYLIEMATGIIESVVSGMEFGQEKTPTLQT